MVPRVTGTLRTQQMTYLVVLPLWPMGRSQWLLPRMSNFLPTASLSVFPLYILSDGMHKGGTTLPGASMETQAESGSLPYRDLSTPTCQYSGTGWGVSLFLSLCNPCLICKMVSATFPEAEEKTPRTWLMSLQVKSSVGPMSPRAAANKWGHQPMKEECCPRSHMLASLGL